MTDETRTSITAGEAARRVGKSVPTITRAIKSGKLSAKPRKPRGWIIEPSVLFSVFDAVTDENNIDTTIIDREIVISNGMLQAKIEVMEQRLSDAQASIEDYRTRLDAESAERRQLTAQITDQRQQPDPPKRRFFGLLRD